MSPAWVFAGVVFACCTYLAVFVSAWAYDSRCAWKRIHTTNRESLQALRRDVLSCRLRRRP